MARMIETPEVSCPVCGQAVEGYEMNAGRVYTVPGGNPFGGDGHIVLTGDDPDPRGDIGYVSKVEAWPAGDVYRLTPCNDRVTREQMVEVWALATATS